MESPEEIEVRLRRQVAHLESDRKKILAANAGFSEACAKAQNERDHLRGLLEEAAAWIGSQRMEFQSQYDERAEFLARIRAALNDGGAT